MHPSNLIVAGLGASTETFVYVVGAGKAKFQTLKNKRDKSLTKHTSICTTIKYGAYK